MPRLKALLSSVLSSFFRATAGLRKYVVRLKSHSLLSSGLSVPLDSSIVVLGPAEVHGTGRVSIGKYALLYPALYLETEESASIELGEGVVLSRGVHIAARAGITIGRGTMIGEYTSIRDANHARSQGSTLRASGYTAKPIVIGNEVWIGRCVTVLGGITIGDGATVGANAVVTHDVPAGTTVAGVPAREIGARPPL